ncbi:MAG: imelysin family protein [Pseudomonadota bacterium]
MKLQDVILTGILRAGAWSGPITALAGPVLARTAAEASATYADIALANYGDSLEGARTLEAAIEVFRFGNPIVDAWEGRVNAWPLDEGLIDCEATPLYGETRADNPFYATNIVANPVLNVAGETIDAGTIDVTLLAAADTGLDRGEMACDQMLAAGNEAGNAMLQTAIDALVAQTRTLERIVEALDPGQLAFEGSDSLDDPEAVFP